MTEQVDLLSQGREPSRGALNDRARAVLGAGLCLALLATGAQAWTASTRHAAAGERAAGSFTPASAPAQLVPRAEAVRISTSGQRADVTSRGHVDLDLQLVNDTDAAVVLLGARMPQPGVRPAAESGALVGPAAAMLAPGTPTAVIVHLVVACPQGLAGPPADHLDLTLGDRSGAVRSISMDLRALPGFWDRVRHVACAVPAGLPGDPTVVAALVVTAVPTSLRWLGGTTSG